QPSLPSGEDSNIDQGSPIVMNLPFKNGAYTWNTAMLASGTYGVHAIVDDGVNELPSGLISQPDDTCVPYVAELPRQRAFAANRFPGTSIFTATGTIQVNDAQAPGAPTGLSL